MQKVLFVDERFYRFSFYYKKESWWKDKDIQPIFKAYEKPIDKWKIYLFLIKERPHYMVFVQLSLKNLLLAKLCNLVGVKTIFWQHGVFLYNDKEIEKYKKIGAQLDHLLSFSLMDEENICRYFTKIKHKRIISHYEIGEIKKSIKIPKSILYIGQILSKEQISISNARIEYDSEGEKILNSFWSLLDNLNYKVFLRKHPGDKSEYLHSLCKKYRNFEMVEDHILPSIVVGHYSTLLIPYMQLGIPFIQLEHKLNNAIDFSWYSKSNILDFQSLDYKNLTSLINNCSLDMFENNERTISHEIYSLL